MAIGMPWMRLCDRSTIQWKGRLTVSQNMFFVYCSYGIVDDVCFRTMRSMLRIRIYIFLIGTLLGSTQLAAQFKDNAFQFLDANKVIARFHNSASRFSDMECGPAYEVPKGSGLHLLQIGGLWIAGMYLLRF
jgi:hypothetical protein